MFVIYISKLNKQAYEISNSVNWEFYLKVLPIYEHTVSLFIESKSSKQKTVSECYKVLFR